MATWRLLINLAWVAAIYTLWSSIRNRAQLFSFGTAGAIVESAYFCVLVLGLLAISILVPYWGLLFNFSH